MATITNFEDLEIWKIARELSKAVYQLSYKEPFRSDYRLSNQMRGSSGSIMDNIAEGFERASRLEFINALGIAKGETGELKSQLYRCLDNKYISQETFNELYKKADTLARKISAFISYLNASHIRGQKFRDREKHH